MRWGGSLRSIGHAARGLGGALFGSLITAKAWRAQGQREGALTAAFWQLISKTRGELCASSREERQQLRLLGAVTGPWDTVILLSQGSGGP